MFQTQVDSYILPIPTIENDTNSEIGNVTMNDLSTTAVYSHPMMIMAPSLNMPHPVPALLGMEVVTLRQ